MAQTITSIRNNRAELNVSPKKEADLVCRGSKLKTDVIIENNKYFRSMAKIINIESGENINKPLQSSTSVINDVEFFIPLADLIDIEVESQRLKSKIYDIEARLNAVKRKLDNKNFVKNAPKKIVDHEKNKYANYKNDYDKLIDNLNNLKG